MARKRDEASQAKKATRPAGHTAPGKRQLNLTVSEETVERLAYLRRHRATELASQYGRTVNPDRLGAGIVEELIFRAYREAKARESAE